MLIEEVDKGLVQVFIVLVLRQADQIEIASKKEWTSCAGNLSRNFLKEGAGETMIHRSINAHNFYDTVGCTVKDGSADEELSQVNVSTLESTDPYSDKHSP
jgi:hypothetical protein